MVPEEDADTAEGEAGKKLSKTGSCLIAGEKGWRREFASNDAGVGIPPFRAAWQGTAAVTAARAVLAVVLCSFACFNKVWSTVNRTAFRLRTV